jgi:hypothetical protein
VLATNQEKSLFSRQRKWEVKEHKGAFIIAEEILKQLPTFFC